MSTDIHSSPTNLHALRRKFARLPESAHKQIALRRIREALALGDRDRAQTEACISEAWYLLPHAEATMARRRQQQARRAARV